MIIIITMISLLLLLLLIIITISSSCCGTSVRASCLQGGGTSEVSLVGSQARKAGRAKHWL